MRAADDTGASMIRDLAAAIIRDGMVLSVCLYKGKEDPLKGETTAV